MQNISITRYKDPKSVGWAGYLEPADKSWIAFIGRDGRPVFFLHRDPDSGAILPDDPEERAAEVARRSGCHYYEKHAHTGTTVSREHVQHDPTITLPVGTVVPVVGEGPIG